MCVLCVPVCVTLTASSGVGYAQLLQQCVYVEHTPALPACMHLVCTLMAQRTCDMQAVAGELHHCSVLCDRLAAAATDCKDGAN
jgi:hypothetical protein